jgi:penicillin-binding protein 2
LIQNTLGCSEGGEARGFGRLGLWRSVDPLPLPKIDMRTNILKPFQGWRLTFLHGVMFAIFALFSLRLYQLQILDSEAYQIAADDNRLSELPLTAPRGAVFDRNGVTLARNVPAFNINIIPAYLPDTEDEILSIYNRLSALVDVPPTIAIARASGRAVRSIEQIVEEGRNIAPYRAVVVALDVDRLVAMEIMEDRINMPGVYVDPIAVREYPTGASTAHIVGYMGPISAEDAERLIAQGYNPAFDRIGYEGVELFLEQQLSGQRGLVRRTVDVAGEVQEEIERIPPIPGQNVRLTIDSELQVIAEQALIDQIVFYNSQQSDPRLFATQGVVIAMNPQNGQVLSMVSWPGYDNTRFARAIDGEYFLGLAADPLNPLVNNAIKGLLPPGSVWKLITSMGIMEERVVDPYTLLLDTGEISVQNRYAPNDPSATQRFVCWKRDGGHGRIDLLGAIAQSCNVYFYQVGGGNENISPQTLRVGGLGINDLFRYATASGVGSELGVELPFEIAGRVPDPTWKRRNYGERWSTGDTYNAALGQGYVLVTPLQLITAVSSIANGGTIYQPTIIDSFLDPEGNVVQSFEPHVLRNLNIDNIPGTITLTLLEDMMMRGGDSLACVCENDASNPFYNPSRCNPDSYTAQVDLNPAPDAQDLRDYRVHIPLNYNFNGQVCQPRRFAPASEPYQPAFVTTPTIDFIRQGTRLAVTEGTAGGEPGVGGGTDLPYVDVAGKTGTAEYCDNIAFPLGLCEFGEWPAHAWFTGYAPYQNPQIIVIAFVYNGQEGSSVGVPIVAKVIEGYCRLQEQRGTPVCRPVPATPS